MITVATKIDKTNQPFNLSNIVCKQWTDEALSITADNFDDLSSVLTVARKLCQKYLPAEIKDQIGQINQPGGLTHLHLRASPTDIFSFTV